ncbi:MAG: SpoIID/LytB domain-containing protein [Acidobacteriota bacterium]|nr:SpoIID/LytB domain-containing protein [Acidobacteriota bacterium]
MSFRHIRYFIILFMAIFFLAGSPPEFGQENEFFHGFLIPKPVISIGLGDNLQDILIRSSSGMTIYEIHGGYTLLAEDADEVRVRGAGGKLAEKYVLLAGQAKERREADLLAEDLKMRTKARIYVEEDRQADIGGVFQVKVGDFLTRGEALEALTALKKQDFSDIWIIREILGERETRPNWILLDGEIKPLSAETVLYFVPSHPESFLSYNGRSYRGLFILRGTRKGVVLVNLLNLEDYLKGVVPGELSPYQFGKIEALKAQAVAARTYAMKNLGQYRDLGYDLVDTPRSQLYGGMSAEHPLSTRAVEETAGEVILHRGELINALYTSTCGGMTEDVENVFSGSPSPYLKSTECTYEKQAEWLVEGWKGPAVIEAGGRNISPDIAFLAAWGIIPFSSGAAFFAEEIPPTEAADWISGALKTLGMNGDAYDPGPDPLSFANLAKMIVRSFRWRDRVEKLMLAGEVNFVLRDSPSVSAEDRPALAYLLQAGFFPSLRQTGDLDKPVTRADLALSLSRIIASLKEPWQQGVFRGRDKETGIFEMSRGSENITVTAVPQPFLIRNLDGDRSLASHLVLLGGETLRWFEKEGRAPVIEVVFPVQSNVLDRTSRYHRWQVRKSIREVEALINQFHPSSDELLDVVVRKRGKSRRAVEIAVRRKGGDLTVRGLRVRYVLGLRDTLFVIDREYDADGRVTHFTFSGRGWGHGVGLCQVGAYGMALSGASYKDIIKKYYTGVKIDRL